ncbi:MBL fold metallo-hydrolase [Tenacibaculum jejuense]|uniref:Metallo-beta-lactamase superfamily protein n=1 Tax=Tenacibaculum jejuense TaxID=584609 RepID=A0A238U7Z4_9FLAO|nr:MBL fold metallo-hydrolase [Tenacibaculum jejuense]SNR15277.1 Metallo-beta-lactamase superfamily protein [Tenacibaculum jejuense]
MNDKKELKVTFLGTGTSTGVPMITSKSPVRFSENPKDKRLRSSVIFSWEDKGEEINYVIDCGPDFRQQMIKADVDSIKGILFTHEHADHIAGFDEIRPYYYKMGPVPIYSDARVLKSLEKRYEYIFTTENRYPSAPEVKSHVISKDDVFEFHGVKITPIRVMHGDLPILGYRFGNIAYLTDVKWIPEEEKEKLRDLDILITTALRLDSHKTHATLEEALTLVEELKPKQAYFSHISELLGFHAEIEKDLPENVFLAYDTLEVSGT